MWWVLRCVYVVLSWLVYECVMRRKGGMGEDEEAEGRGKRGKKGGDTWRA